MYKVVWMFALVLGGCVAAPVPGAPSPSAPTVAATTNARTTTPDTRATPQSQATVPTSTTSTVHQFTGMRDGIAYTYAVRFRPKGDYAGITYPNDHLLIHYRFANSGQDAIVFNRIVAEVAMRGEVYVDPQPDGVIALSQRAFAEPTDRSCPARDAPIVPRGSWLRAGDTATGQQYVEVPLKQFTPFDDCAPLPPMLPESAPVRVCFGYVRPADNITIDENGWIELLFSDMHALIAAQQLLCSDDFTREALQ